MSRTGVAIAVAGLLMVASAGARADECPVGAVEKSEDGQTWCEPTVCETDAQCATGSVCRPAPLCVEVGTLQAKPGSTTDAGQKLLARQRCGANKECPQTTTCSEKSRCMTRTQADKAGILTAAGPGTPGMTSSGVAPAPGEAPKKSCGCSVVGARGGELGGAALAMLGAIAIGMRRRSRGTRPAA